MIKRYIYFLAVVSTELLIGQASPASDYYPIAQGLEWSYKTTYQLGQIRKVGDCVVTVGARVETIFTLKRSCKESGTPTGELRAAESLISVEGDKVYTVTPNTNPPQKALRIDFSLGLGQTTALQFPCILLTLESKTDTVQTPAGVFTNCLRFYERSESAGGC